MPLNLTDAIVHTNSGGVATTSTSAAITISLAGGDTTEAGNLLVAIVAGPGVLMNSAFPAVLGNGWTFQQGGGGGSGAYGWSVLWYAPADGESSWNFTPTSTAGFEATWQIFELSGMQTVDPLEVAISTSLNGGTGTTAATAVGVAKNVSYDALMVAAHIFCDADNTTPATWSGHTNSFTEVLESGQASSGTRSTGLSVSMLPVTTLAQYSTTATASRTYAANETISVIFGLTAANAPKQTDMVQFDGGESYQLGTVTGSVTLDAAAARSGAVGYLLNSTAAACSKSLPTGTASPTTMHVFRWCFRVPNLNDRAEIAYFPVTVSGGNGAKTLTLRMTGGQLGLVWSGGVTAGSEVLSNQAITANQWVGIDIRIDRRTALAYKVDWSVDYNAELTDTTPGVPQTAVTATNALGTFLSLTCRLGWTSALTSVMHVDDLGSASGHNYPIGDLRVLPLKVDPAGTPTITGTGATANFGVMTNNGTVAAWNATNARNAVDDIPPIAAGVGTRDAAVALLAHASDNASFPMETHNLAANRVNVRGVKCHWWVWAASATATTLRVLVSDGVTTHTMFAEASPGASNTTQVYSSAMVRASATTPPDWTQAKVDALAVQFGSNDANPDVGLDAMLLELAVVRAQPEVLSGSPGDPVYVEAHRDPLTYGLVGFTVNTDASTSATVDWDDNGSTGSTGLVGPSSSTYQELSPDSPLAGVRLTITPG
jgi:hypothetical protein